MKQTALDAVLVCPNRALAQEFSSKVSETDGFSVLADLKTYPTPQQIDARLRQLRPDVVLLDLGTDTDAAVALVSAVSSLTPPIHLIGIDSRNDANVIIRSLRAGATEFLCSPFESEAQNTVTTRVRRLQENEQKQAPTKGKVIAFVGAKAGQGVTTIASNVAAGIANGGERKVFLADFDIEGGTVSFIWRLNHSYSVLDALRNSEKLDSALWKALVTSRHGVDVLLAPELPEGVPLEAHRFNEVIEFARSTYEYIVVDLPSVWSKQAKATLGDVDFIYLVCNPELPSLHLTRKCITYLEQLGFASDKFGLLVNRMSRKQELGPADMERVFNFPIGKVFSEDGTAVHRALTAGKPIGNGCELGRSINQFGNRIFGIQVEEKKRSVTGLKLSALLSHS